MMVTDLRARVRDDAGGFTLVELMVAMTIFSLIMGSLAAGVIHVQRAAHQVEVRTDNIDQARLAIAGVSRSLRAAVPSPDDDGPAFAIAEGDHAMFTAYLGSPEVPVRIELERDDDGVLTERVRTAAIDVHGTVAYPASNERVRVLAAGLVPTGRIFTYTAIDGDGERVPLGPGPDAQQRSTVSSVRIDLAVSRDASGRVAGEVLSTEVRLPNRVVTS